MGSAKDLPFRLFNPRVLLLFAAYLILGIFCVILDVWVAAPLMGVAILFLFLPFKARTFRRGLLIALCLAMIGGYGLATLSLHLRNDVGPTGEITVTCRVADLVETENGKLVTADRLRRDGTLLGGKLSFETEDTVANGDRLTVRGVATIRKVALDSISGALEYRKGTKYSLDSATILSRAEGAPPLRSAIREKVKTALLSAQGKRAGGFSYAMLFGDSEYMRDSDKEAMRETGVAHVIAVSGLHVGVLAAALLFLLKKLRLKEGVCLLILLPIFGFYAYLAEFTPSVLRASIMVSVSLAASALGERYDDISALSFAAILILAVRPLYLFDLSFLMSFLAILGIQSLGMPLERSFRRHKVPPRLASGLALSASTTISLIPVSAIVFGRIALAGFLLNLIIVPIASIAFILNFVVLPFALLFPTVGAVLSLIGYLPELIAETSRATASLGFETNYDFSVAETALYYATIAFIGKYSLAKRKAKLVAAGIGGSVLILLLLAA